MSSIKSFSVGNGDMFYIRHNSENFTIIDCYLKEDNRDRIVAEIRSARKGKSVTRFISTHPDEDHIGGLHYLDDAVKISNFYCVKNKATKPDITDGFKRYCELREDSNKAYYLYEGCRRKFMNRKGKYGSSGLTVLWPKTSNIYYKEELIKAKEGTSFNNISIILRYSLSNGASVLWMGDLENNFMEKIKDEVSFRKTNILFLPHHGRKSGKLPMDWIDQINPDVIIKGEANSKDSDYVSNPDRNKIHQNSAKDIVMDLKRGKVHFYVSDESYSVDFLDDEGRSKSGYNYIGTLNIKK